jgi:hypothetical protein
MENDKQPEKTPGTVDKSWIARVRREELALIHKLSIVELLREWGHEPVRQTAKKAIYRSPLHDRGTPSFVVFKKADGGDWCDFETKQGGSIVDLVMAMKGVAYVEAMRMLRKRLYGHVS